MGTAKDKKKRRKKKDVNAEVEFCGLCWRDCVLQRPLCVPSSSRIPSSGVIRVRSKLGTCSVRQCFSIGGVRQYIKYLQSSHIDMNMYINKYM